MILISGKNYRDTHLEVLKEKVRNLEVKLGLAVIQVGDDEASNIYIKQKEKLALELNYIFVHKKFNEDVSNFEVINYIKELNNDDSIDGIIVQLPIPDRLDKELIINSIDPLKDVDGLTNINAGKLFNNSPALIPCPPKGIMELLDEYNIDVNGMNAVVIGRSNLVGKPVEQLLTNRNATVTVCHSKTKDIGFYTRNADLIVVAAGKPSLLTGDMIKEGSIIIDVGISRIDGVLHGDVDYDSCKEKASYITPVPGGVGPMTVYELMNNVFLAHNLRKKVF
jgi:methylenetetrahydrofolate dehydrogenase (NADP+)/methenyltetrahydrofolate cyclohydrolase